MSGTCGPTSRMPFASYDPETSCWRMSEVTLSGDSEPFSETWPRSGMTRGGCAYELPMPALPTAGPVSSSLLPTPVVNDMGKGKTVEAWDEWTARMQEKHANGNSHGPSLAIEAVRLLKTPTAQLGENGGSQHPDKRREGGHGPTLADEIEHLLPTPIAGDGKGGRNATACRRDPNSTAHRGMTLGDWLRMRGESTAPAFAAGSASSADELLGQLSLLLEAESD